MPLLIDLRRLSDDSILIEGELSPAELDIVQDDECVALKEPLHYRLSVQKQDDNILVMGELSFVLDCECVRCLRPFKMPIKTEYADFLPLEGEDAVLVKDDCIDLTFRLREDTLLAYPQHPLCDVNCDRLPNNPVAGKKNKKMGSCAESNHSLSAWGELDKLELD